MPIAICYIMEEEQHVLEESGVEEMPYVVPRWWVISGEVHGRSPAMTALPQIKVSNAATRTVMRAAEKAVDPPLTVPHENLDRAGSPVRRVAHVSAQQGRNRPDAHVIVAALRGRIHPATRQRDPHDDVRGSGAVRRRLQDDGDRSDPAADGAHAPARPGARTLGERIPQPAGRAGVRHHEPAGRFRAAA